MDIPLTLTHGTQILHVNQLGGGLITYDIHHDGVTRRILHGYEDGKKVGAKGDVLFPYPGRLKNAAYEFQGASYQLYNVYMKGQDASHGFVRQELWNILERTESSLTLSCSFTEEEASEKGYPFALSINVTYILSDTGLEVATQITNVGTKAAPFGLGFHPYFRVGTERVDDIEMSLPVNSLVAFDDHLEPTGEIIDVGVAGLDFRSEKPIADQVIDACFTDLVRDEDGRARTNLGSAADQGVTMWQDASFPYIQIFTSDTLPEGDARKGLAVEPQTCTGYAFNHPELGLLTLEPDELFEGSWGIDPF